MKKKKEIKKFRVWLERQALACIEIEAKTAQEAEQKALDIPMGQWTWEIQGKPELREDITEEVTE